MGANRLQYRTNLYKYEWVCKVWYRMNWLRRNIYVLPRQCGKHKLYKYKKHNVPTIDDYNLQRSKPNVMETQKEFAIWVVLKGRLSVLDYNSQFWYICWITNDDTCVVAVLWAMIEVNQGLAGTCRVFGSVLWDGPFVRGSALGALWDQREQCWVDHAALLRRPSARACVCGWGGGGSTPPAHSPFFDVLALHRGSPLWKILHTPLYTMHYRGLPDSI